jgi:hypothetical protein
VVVYLPGTRSEPDGKFPVRQRSTSNSLTDPRRYR